MVTSTINNNNATTVVMDPWGGSVNSDATANSNNVPGFDDNFSDATDFAETSTAIHVGDCRSFCSSSSSSSEPRVFTAPLVDVPNNFISRLPSANVVDSSSFPHPPHSANLLLPSFPPLQDPLKQMMTSEEYVSRLEAKLLRIRGGGAGGSKRDGRKGLSTSAKQMIEALSTVKQSHALLSTDGGDAFSDSSINPNFLMQRAFPERSALTQEELDSLIKHDHLQPSAEFNEDSNDVDREGSS